MSRKHDTLTPRQRQSQHIMREKAAKKRRDAWKRKLQFVGGAVLGVLVVGCGGISWYTGAFTRTADAVAQRFYDVTAGAGLSVRSLHVEGRNRTPMNEIITAINVKKGAPILQYSLEEMREQLKTIPTVRDAAVERALPNNVYVRIVEREPAAIWQYQGMVSLVDDQGVVMRTADMTPYMNLPLIVGDGAARHVAELMEILRSVPQVAQQFASAIRVGDRRWNIRLKDNIEVRLPEEGAADALAKLVRMSDEEQLLKRDITVIDLRLPDRMFIKRAPQPVAPASGAKEI